MIIRKILLAPIWLLIALLCLVSAALGDVRVVRVEIFNYGTIGHGLVVADADHTGQRYAYLTRGGVASVVVSLDNTLMGDYWMTIYDPLVGWNADPIHVGASDYVAAGFYESDNLSGISLARPSNDAVHVENPTQGMEFVLLSLGFLCACIVWRLMVGRW